MRSCNPYAWEQGFPPVYGHTSLSFLKRCPGFHEAKLGDLSAALAVVKMCINPAVTAEIRRCFADALLLPVVNGNKLPEALAYAIGMETCTGVYELETLRRKSLGAMERLLHKPVFTGTIQKNRSYILVDDVVTQGGTVAELRKYVIANGGAVAAIAALTLSAGSRVLTPGQEDIFSLINRFSLQTITDMLRSYNIAYDLRELTRAQIRYLLLFKEPEGLLHKVESTQLSRRDAPGFILYKHRTPAERC